MAPREGFEPPARRLTAACSTAELPGIRRHCVKSGVCSKPFSVCQGRFSSVPFRSCPARLNWRIWRPRAESNRCTGICSPLHDHSATRPSGCARPVEPMRMRGVARRFFPVKGVSAGRGDRNPLYSRGFALHKRGGGPITLSGCRPVWRFEIGFEADGLRSRSRKHDRMPSAH